MRKRLMSLILVSVMIVTLFAGCGQKPVAATVETIKIYQMHMYPVDNTEVVAAINAISREKCNVNIELNQLLIGDYIQQLPLMMSSGEKFDLVMCTAIPTCGFTMMSAQGQLKDITPYLDQYAPKTKAMMADYLPSTTLGDAVYAIPCYRQYNSNMYLMMREDILTELGLVEKAAAATSWGEIESIFAAVDAAKDSLPEGMQVDYIFGATNSQGSMLTSGSSILGDNRFVDSIGFDQLGDNNLMIYTDSATDTVSSMFENSDYADIMERLWSWSKRGWLYEDALKETDNCGDAGARKNIYFAYLSTGEFGQEKVKEQETGLPWVVNTLVSMPIATQTGSQWAWAVPASSEKPEAALSFLELMYTMPEIENLLVYGIEGKDYEVVDGEACVLPDYRYTSNDFFYGNQFAALPKQGTGASFREEALANMKAAEMSKYYGLSIDTTPIADDIANVFNVLQEVQLPLEAGQLDPKIAIPELVEKTRAAGMDRILAFYQQKVDEFLSK